MSKIIFGSISYSNFRSVGNTPITIDLNNCKTTLITGANGSGKTTILHALCFALFGKGFGDITKPSLMNSINLKQLLVTVEFSILKKKYRVVRGMKPNKFEIYEDDKLINQDAASRDYQKVLEQQILKFNYRAFTQVIAISGGSDYSPFMTLAAKDRREFVEDLLDIRVFSTMNTLAKEQQKAVRDALKDTDVSMRSKKEKIVLQEAFISKLKKQKEESADNLLNTINTLTTSNALIQDECDIVLGAIGVHELGVDRHSNLDDQLIDVRLHGKQLKAQLIKKRDKKDIYSELTECPTCNQAVAESHKEKIIREYEEDIDSVMLIVAELEKEDISLRVLMQEYDDDILKFSQLQTKLRELNTSIYANNAVINNANKQLNTMQSDTSNIDEEQTKLKSHAVEYMALVKRKKEMLGTQQYQEFVQHILSDAGIKAKIIKQYIPTINKLINKYLADFDFFVSFHLDEQFNETIKSRHRDTFTYQNFSEGQKRRIDMAILLTWMDVARAKNAIHTNIAFFDEIDSVLDKEGADMLHSALKSCSSDNIFIISHKGDTLFDKVDNSIHFRLHNNFTEVVDNI